MSDYMGNAPKPTGKPTDVTAGDDLLIEVLCIGGHRHGERVGIKSDAKTWVDLVSAETYYREGFDFVAQSPVNPHSTLLRQGFHLEALVHESLSGDRAMANAWVQALALQRLFQMYGEERPVEEIARRHTGGAGASSAPQN